MTRDVSAFRLTNFFMNENYRGSPIFVNDQAVYRSGVVSISNLDCEVEITKSPGEIRVLEKDS